MKNPLAGQLGWNYYNVVGGRVAGRWTPVDGLTVDLAYDYTKDENTPFFSQLINYNPNSYHVGTYIGRQLPVQRSNCRRPTPYRRRTVHRPLSPLVVVSGDNRQTSCRNRRPAAAKRRPQPGFSGNIKYKVSPELELRSITAGARSAPTSGTIRRRNAVLSRAIFQPEHGRFSRYSLSELFQHQFSQEFQAVGSIAHRSIMSLGALLLHRARDEAAATPSTNRWNADGTGYTILSENGIGVAQPPLQLRQRHGRDPA